MFRYICLLRMVGFIFIVSCFGGVDIAGEGVGWIVNIGCLVGLRLVLIF